MKTKISEKKHTQNSREERGEAVLWFLKLYICLQLQLTM